MTESHHQQRIAIYSRPWTVELSIALDHFWRSRGAAFSCEHLTQHAESAARLRSEGLAVRFLTEEIAALAPEEPVATLTEIQQRLGSGLRPLNRYRMAERYFEDRDPAWQLDQLSRYARWFDRYFAESAPLGLIGEWPDVLSLWLAYDMARAHDVPVVEMIPSVVPPDRVYPMSDYAEIPGARDRFEELIATGLTDEDRDRARRSRESAPYGAAVSYLHSRTTRDRVQRMLNGRFIREQIAHNRAQTQERKVGNWHVQPKSLEWMSDRVLTKTRGRFADRRYLTAPMPERPFLFFPLHFQPEASTLIAGSYFVNQLEVVRSLAKSVPIGWEVAVKEHFWMRGQRELDFYRELEAIPNVSLTALDIPTRDLVDRAEVLAVIASNAGLEASLGGKGVLAFGEVPWDYAPSVVTVGPMIDLPGAISDAAAANRDPEDDAVLAFAASWDEALPEARFYEDPVQGWAEPENLAAIAGVVESRLGLTADAAGSILPGS
jgi:hypothetical protein